MTEYIPGVCNIGPYNRVVRAVFGVALFAVSFLVYNFAVEQSYTKLFYLVLFIPFYYAYLGILQAMFSFCVLNAGRKTYDLR